MSIQFVVNPKLEAAALGSLFERSGIRRPSDDLERLQRMIDNANLIIAAYDGERLVGVARALTDFSWCCYLSDLAIDIEYQSQGIGRELIRRVQAEAGDEAAFILLSAPSAMEYYPKVGLQPITNGFMLKRAR